MPLIWPNQGNEGNVMITERGGKAISIDAKIIPIDPVTNKDIFDDYLEKIEDLVQALVNNPGQEIAQFRLVRDAITAFTGWDIEVEGTVKMQKAFLDTINRLEAEDFLGEVGSWIEVLKKFENMSIFIHFFFYLLDFKKSRIRSQS